MAVSRSRDDGRSVTDDLPPLPDHHSSAGLPHDESLEAASHEAFMANEAARNEMRRVRAKELRRRAYHRRKAARAAVNAQMAVDGVQGWYRYKPGLPGLARHIAKGNVHAPNPEEMAALEEMADVHTLVLPEIKTPPIENFVKLTSIAECTDALIGVPFEEALIASAHGDIVPFARLFNYVSDTYDVDIGDLLIVSRHILEDQRDRLTDHIEREFGQAFETQFAKRQFALEASHRAEIRRLTDETSRLRKENRAFRSQQSNQTTDWEQDVSIRGDDEDMDYQDPMFNGGTTIVPMSNPGFRSSLTRAGSPETLRASRTGRFFSMNGPFVVDDDDEDEYEDEGEDEDNSEDKHGDGEQQTYVSPARSSGLSSTLGYPPMQAACGGEEDRARIRHSS